MGWHVRDSNYKPLLSGSINWDTRRNYGVSTKAQVVAKVKEEIYDASNQGRIPKVNKR